MTLIELLVVVALIIIVMAVVAPSFNRFIDTQRVKNTNAMVVTDMQLARSEAASRGARVRVTFRVDPSQTCYTIYTYDVDAPSTKCNCLLSNPCPALPAGSEIKTTRIPRDTKVLVYPDLTPGPTAPAATEFAFEPLAGGLYTVPQDFAYDILSSFTIRTFIDAQRELRTIISLSGRPTVCAPATSKMVEAAC